MRILLAATLACISLPAFACDMSPLAVTPEGFGLVKTGMSLGAAAKATGGAIAESDELRTSDSCYYADFKEHGHDGGSGGEGVRFRVENAKITVTEVLEGPYKTPEGISIGSTIEALKAAYPGKWAMKKGEDADNPDITVKASSDRGYTFSTHNGKVSFFKAGLLKSLQRLEGCM